MPAETHLFLCLKDNYGVLLHDPQSGATTAIDAPEVAPIEAALKATGWRADLPHVAASIGMAGKPAADVFAEIRERKNRF
jgi:hypothetical protein